MSTIKSTSYNIYIGNESFDKLNLFLSKHVYNNYVILCDEHTFEHCLPTLLFHCAALNTAEIIELESGEEHKVITTCLQVWGALTDMGADKKSLLINLGGGVITDLGGFVASTYKRGMDFINIPTTLLAMVDASVGGKTGIDFENIKNHIGTTYEPKAIFINPLFLETLEEKQIKNGYAEIIKIALIADKGFWGTIKKLKKPIQFCSEKIITKAIKLKNEIVKKDLYETGLRKSLNFGHTVGHALESSLIKERKPILHGEAVAAGIIVELRLAYNLHYISRRELNEITNYISTIYTSTTYSNKTIDLALSFMTHDKKNNGSLICFALPKPIGSYSLCYNVTTEQIKNALIN